MSAGFLCPDSRPNYFLFLRPPFFAARRLVAFFAVLRVFFAPLRAFLAAAMVKSPKLEVALLDRSPGGSASQRENAGASARCVIHLRGDG